MGKVQDVAKQMAATVATFASCLWKKCGTISANKGEEKMTYEIWKAVQDLEAAIAEHKAAVANLQSIIRGNK